MGLSSVVRHLILVLGILLVLQSVSVGIVAEVPKRDDGIHTQPWIRSLTFLDLKEDLTEAKNAGKGLVVLFEQPGCVSCKRLHEVNFSNKEVVGYITKNFDVLQINMYGDNEVTDMDGSVINERKFAERMRIHFTPTTVFFNDQGREVFRVPGYIGAQFYKRAFEYVVDKGLQKKILFPRWQRERRNQKSGS